MPVSDLSDYGFLLSQLGLDVQDAADSQLVASSGWPNLKIHYTQAVVVAAGGSYTYTHSLGYPPLVLLEISNDTNVAGGGTYQAFGAATVTTTTLTFGDLSLYSSGCTVRFFIFRLPINVPFQSKIYSLSTQAAVAKDKNVGLKIMKTGKKMDSTDLRDYNYHSSTRAPMVHVVATGVTTTVGSFNEFSWVNDLGYVPIFFAFNGGAAGTTWTPRNGLEQSPPKLFVDPVGNMKIQVAPSGQPQQYVSIIAFKDPFAVGVTTNVTI